MEGLADLRAPGTMPEDNRILKAIYAHGGADGLFKGVHALCQGRVHPTVRSLLTALRAALLEKRDMVTNKFLGYRPLGMTEKIRCIAFICMNHQCKESIDWHFTHPLPEDVSKWEIRRDEAAAQVTARPPV